MTTLSLTEGWNSTKSSAFSIANEGLLNFIGNKFEPSRWLDFQREGNDWFYHYCHRQRSIIHDPKLKYQYLAKFDNELIYMGKKYDLSHTQKGHQLWSNNEDKILAYERGNLIFISNFYHDKSQLNLRLPVPQPSKYKIILNTDHSNYGGRNRVYTETEYFTEVSYDQDALHIYIPCRTSLVLKKV